MRLIAFRQDASGNNFDFRRCFILDAEKSFSLKHDLVPVLLQETEYIKKCHITEIGS